MALPVSSTESPADKSICLAAVGFSSGLEWRYAEWNEAWESRQLYQHATDPHEFHNLAIKPTTEIVATIAGLRRWLQAAATVCPPASPVNPARRLFASGWSFHIDDRRTGLVWS